VKSTKWMIVVVILSLLVGFVAIQSWLFVSTNDRPISGREIYNDLLLQGIDVVKSEATDYTMTTTSYTDFLSQAQQGSYVLLAQTFYSREEGQQVYFRERVWAYVVRQGRVVLYNPDGNGISWEAYYDSMNEVTQQQAERSIPWDG
jgi:hypothetical protein